MTLTAFFLIVGSAVFHASWNLLAKKSRMTLVFYTLMCTGSALFWGHVQFWTPVAVFRLPWQFWCFLAGSILSDVVYCYALIQVYRKMDMVTAYPIMRSLPILLTAGVTLLFGIGKPLTGLTCLGFVIVFAGAVIMPLTHFSDFKLSGYLTWNMFFILQTAAGTTGYTVLDSLAQGVLCDRYPAVSGAVRSLTYYSTREIFLVATYWSLVFLTSEGRADVRQCRKERDFTPVWAGAFATVTYILVLMAMNYVTNVSYVQVFRQLGLPIGMLLGVLILKERCTLPKIIGIILILGGLTISTLKF